jgi:hypothetical protein
VELATPSRNTVGASLQATARQGVPPASLPRSEHTRSACGRPPSLDRQADGLRHGVPRTGAPQAEAESPVAEYSTADHEPPRTTASMDSIQTPPPRAPTLEAIIAVSGSWAVTGAARVALLSHTTQHEPLRTFEQPTRTLPRDQAATYTRSRSSQANSKPFHATGSLGILTNTTLIDT